MGPQFGDAETVTTANRNFERSVREALEIQRHRSAPIFGGMNQDDGQYLKTTFWVLFMDWITKEEKERNRNQHATTSHTNLTSNTSTTEDNAPEQNSLQE